MAMPTRSKAGVVLNPRNIPKKTPILTEGDRSFFEGDKVTTADLSDWAGLVERGFVRVI
jgi:hypothetical protein|tara:strand:+ start:4908 stop:5084 length:177 start_codon:yes stop_codon:yes gene_type:complete